MILFEEACKLVLESVFSLGSERIPYTDSLDRVLAEDVFSDMEMPPFDKAAVDGYACRRDDLNGEIKIIEVIPAGKQPENTIRQGECAKIMTGAMVPGGADMVVMVEDTKETGRGTVRFLKGSSGNNICYKAEDLHSGERVLSKGTIIRPQEVAVMASVGCIRPQVFKKPAISIISTGDELVEPDQTPGISQIRNSNASQLAAQLRKMGIVATYSGIAGDNRRSLHDRIGGALRQSDVVLLTGGVSMGEYDYVPEVLEDLGIRILIKSIAIQPGRPTIFAINGQKRLFGLPGNPVSSFVIFELLVKPLLYQMMGHDHKPLTLRLPMGVDFSRTKSARKSLLPVRITEDGTVVPVDYHGSAHIHSYTGADGIMFINIGVTSFKKGDNVDVRPV
jgi:molybdopterin molybdotransferase